MPEMQTLPKPAWPTEHTYLERRANVLQQFREDYAVLTSKIEVLRAKNVQISQEILSMISQNKALIDRCLDAYQQ